MGSVARNRPIASVGNEVANRGATLTAERSQTRLPSNMNRSDTRAALADPLSRLVEREKTLEL